MDDDDELDAFFDDVEHAVQEVQRTDLEDSVTGPSKAPTEVPTEVPSEEPTEEPSKELTEGDSRPAKRAKHDSKHDSKVGSKVVAASAPVNPINLAVASFPAASQPASQPASQLANPSSSQTPTNTLSAINRSLLSSRPSAAPPNPSPALPSSAAAKPHIRSAAGQTWSDATLAQWPPNDYRLFVGNLAKDLRQHHLEEAFSKYPSFAMARIVFHKHDNKSRGYGFVSLLDPKDCALAIREMDQAWLGSRPMKVRRSDWKDREWKEVKKKSRKEKRDRKRFGF